MSFSGNMAYGMLMALANIYPSMKTKIADVKNMDFHNAPETYMYYAEELCAGNVRAYKIAYDRAGIGDRLHIHIQPKMMHGYSSVPVFPESKRCFEEAIKLLNEV